MSTVHHPKPEIVYEDEDILILNKPVGILSQKAEKNDYSANEMVIDYLLESGQLTRAELRTFHPSICNRLDRNTSGLLIAGKTIRGLQEMAEALKSRSMQKVLPLPGGRTAYTGCTFETDIWRKNHQNE